jgi:hypothetical protein
VWLVFHALRRRLHGSGDRVVELLVVWLGLVMVVWFDGAGLRDLEALRS